MRRALLPPLAVLAAGCTAPAPGPGAAASQAAVPDRDTATPGTSPSDTGAAEPECVPPHEQTMRPDTARAYAAMCEPELGVVPNIDCGAGARIPVYVDGVEVFEDPGFFNCDNPHAGQCTPGSTLQRYEGRSADGSPRPEVVWVGFCRHDQQAEDAENHVQIIGYNRDSGATCFFGRSDNSAWTSVDENNVMQGVLPGPDDPGFDTAFAVPDEKVCVQCHQSNPFIHTPWIDSAELDDGSGEPIVPIISGFQAPYYVVGAPEWDLRTLYIEGNSCLECHRVGMDTVRLLGEEPWFVAEEMPPSDPGSMAADFQALVDCWEAGPENTPGCEWITPPAGACDWEVAGADYPNQGAQHNQGAPLPHR